MARLSRITSMAPSPAIEEASSNVPLGPGSPGALSPMTPNPTPAHGKWRTASGASVAELELDEPTKHQPPPPRSRVLCSQCYPCLAETLVALLAAWVVTGAFFVVLPQLEPLSWTMAGLFTAGLILVGVPFLLAAVFAALSHVGSGWVRTQCHEYEATSPKRLAEESSTELPPPAAMRATSTSPARGPSALGRRVVLGEARARGRGACCSACLRVCCRFTAIALGAFVFTGLVLALMRRLGPQHLDDVHPSLLCPFMARFVARPQRQLLWIIPMHEHLPISTYPDWCARMRGLAAAGEVTLGMHGVYHDSNDEFLHACAAGPCAWGVRNVTGLLDEGIREFQRCFGAAPRHFAPPGQHISPRNLDIVRDVYGMQVRTTLDGLTSRIYHCDDTFCPNPILCTTSWLDYF